jgi:hypothetical protein
MEAPASLINPVVDKEETNMLNKRLWPAVVDGVALQKEARAPNVTELPVWRR